jgi:hypothetical protein
MPLHIFATVLMHCTVCFMKDHVDVSKINARFKLYIRTVMEVSDSTCTFCFSKLESA